MGEKLRWNMTLPNGEKLRWDMGPQYKWDGEVPDNPNPPQPMPDPENRVSSEITNTTLAAILQKIGEAEALLSGILITLTDEERKHLLKLGPTLPAFDQGASQDMQTSPQFIPDWVTPAETAKDIAIYNPLGQIEQRLATFQRKVEDTMMEVGHEIRTDTNAYYENVKGAAKRRVPGAQTVVDHLAPLYPNRRRRRSSGSSGTGSGTP
jgi:hypothetical protein